MGYTTLHHFLSISLEEQWNITGYTTLHHFLSISLDEQRSITGCTPVMEKCTVIVCTKLT